MFNNDKKFFSKPETKQAVLVGVVIILVGAIIALLVLLNYYFTSKLSQIQNLSVQNNQRIVAIENFLNTIENQLKAQSQNNLINDLSGAKK
jgi:uncharacterized membrane protein